MVANIKPDKPYFWVIGKRITTKAAVGPVILNREPPNNAAKKPATITVYNPCCGGTPTAIANAIPKGIATIPTVIPDTISARNLEKE